MAILKGIKNIFVHEKSATFPVTREDLELNDLVKFFGLEGVDADALSEATYFACIKVLSEAVGKLPLKLQHDSHEHGPMSAKNRGLYHKVGKRPNPYMTSTVFWTTMEANRNHYGNAYALITGAGDNQQLWILPNDNVEVYYDDKLIMGAIPDIYYIYTIGLKTYTLKSEEVIHVKTSNTFDGVMGIPVRLQLASTIEGGAKAQNVVNKMYDSGFTAKAVLQYTGSLNDEMVKTMVKGVDEYATGKIKDMNAIIPIPLGHELTPLNIKLADSQFIEVKQYTALQIAAAFGIKPNQIGDYSKSSYASAEAQQLSFYIDTLLYIIKQYEEELDYKLLTDTEVQNGFEFKFNVGVILRADFKTQIETLSKGINSFLLTPDEARAYIDKPKKAGGDRLLGNGAAITLEQVGTQYGNTVDDPSTDDNLTDEGEDGKEETDE